jgi:A/G-specific adenine glycosylase
MEQATIDAFQKTVWDYYHGHGRHDLPWRLPVGGPYDPYRIMVSELMLQQTQVLRVIPKFQAFVERFPTAAILADAPLADVLREWSGLGYNRRAKFLWQAAQMIVNTFDGQLPNLPEELVRLPGIGIHTAGAIAAYAFNEPVVFIETNIRTVFIYHFFAGHQAVTDRQITDCVQQTLSERQQTREWYWALMDYGSHLKTSVGNLARASTGYAKQTSFEGSARQVRGQVLRLLADAPRTDTALRRHIADDRLPIIIEGLLHERLIQKHGERFSLGA